MTQLYSNNASTVLIEDLLPSDTIINLAPGAGEDFPLPDAGDPLSFFKLTLEDVNANFEICKCEERSGDILTIIRAQEGTAPAGFAIGSRCETRFTAGSLDNFKQVTDQWELRGDTIDSDGIRYWHQQDPSTYQFYTIRFYTADVFGIPVMHIEPPPSLPGLNVMLGVVAADGTQRVARLGPDTGGAAPAPATGEVHWEVPGVMRWVAIDNPLGGQLMYSTFAGNPEGAGNLLKFEMQGTSAVAYSWVAQSEGGFESTAGINNQGNGYFVGAVEVQNAEKSTYPDALDFSIDLLVDPTDPGTADRVSFVNSVAAAASRAFSYVFFTVRRDTTVEPAEYLTEAISIKDGQVKVAKDPEGGNDLTRKVWVEALVEATTTGQGLDVIQQALYGRTVMWSNDAGVNDGTTQTYTGGAGLNDFWQIEITSKYDASGGDTQFYSMRVDTQTMIDKGYTNSKWAVIPNAGSGQDNREAFFNPKSLTTFTATQSNASDGKVVRVLGLNPKVQ